MIELRINLHRDGCLKGFQASGHAGSGKKGEDIVCAAVTVLLRTAARLISGEKGLETGGEALRPGEMTFFLISMPAEYTEWVKGAEKLQQFENLLSEDYIKDLVNKAKSLKEYKLIIEIFDGLSQKDLKNFSVRVLKQSENLIIIFLNKVDNGIMVLGMMAPIPAQKSEFNMGNFIKECMSRFNGKGGGRKDYGQGFIDNKDLNIEEIKIFILKRLNSI
ncbi:hypothetical protein LCGC14_2500580 [marine sediment metagenome]|uniref:Alanine--tRNA ligase n=1 Tax=marine sediment metagenome TaxID=412755 RepID=A0A0F9B1X8_9ZZZZ